MEEHAEYNIQKIYIGVLEMKLFISVNADSLLGRRVRTQNAPVTFHQPTSYTSDQAASHATITNGKLENERALFSAAAAFLGMICSFRRLENRAGDAGTPQRSLEGFG